MRNMLNGLDDFSNVEVAFFPCGMTNDFLKVLGGEEPFKNIDALINGKTVPVDYIKTNYGVAINTKGMRCSRDNDYVYIEKNMAIPCHNMIPIKNYRVSECPQDCRIGECTLCGHMSIFN